MRLIFRYIAVSGTIVIALLALLSSTPCDANKWLVHNSVGRPSSRLLDIFAIRGGAKSKKDKSSKKAAEGKKKKPEKKEVKKASKSDDDSDDTKESNVATASDSKIETSPVAGDKETSKPALADGIAQMKLTARSLIVDDSSSDDHSTVALSAAKMEELGLLSGDTVLLKGKKRKSTVAVVNSDDNVDDVRIQTTKVIRSNLR